MKHTPGPWQASFGWNKDEGTYANITDTKGNILFQTPDNFKIVEPKKQERNTALAAAAPDLLEACQYILAELSIEDVGQRETEKAILRISEAIRKATD